MVSDTKAATKIQSLYRGHSVRREQRRRKAAATKLQAAFRGHAIRRALSGIVVAADEAKTLRQSSVNWLNAVAKTRLSRLAMRLATFKPPPIQVRLCAKRGLSPTKPLPVRHKR